MIKRGFEIFATLVLAFGILGISLFRAASVHYAFSQSQNLNTKDFSAAGNIDYTLAYSGKILPNSSLWPLKALRDKFWLFVNTNALKKAEILLLFADKRLASAQNLVKEDNFSLGVATITKAEKYLEEAQKEERRAKNMGMDTSLFLDKLIWSSLKHRQILEEILIVAPEDAKPEIVKFLDYSKRVFVQAQVSILEAGGTPPSNPFEK